MSIFFTDVPSSWTNCELGVLNIGRNALQGGGMRENLEKYGTLVIGFCVMTRIRSRSLVFQQFLTENCIAG